MQDVRCRIQDERNMNILERKNAILVSEFDKYVMEHQEFAKKIPRNSQVVLQLEGDEEYNEWSRKIAEKQREAGQKVAYIQIKGLRPAHSRLIAPKLKKIA